MDSNTERQQMSDHDLLIRIDERTERTEERLNNHGDRLRDLEQNQSKLTAYIVAIGSGITIALNWIWHTWDKIWK